MGFMEGYRTLAGSYNFQANWKKWLLSALDFDLAWKTGPWLGHSHWLLATDRQRLASLMSLGFVC